MTNPIEPGDVRRRLATAAARLDVIIERRDAAFEAMKAKHVAESGDPNGWIRHVEEMARATMSAVPDDPWPDLCSDFDAIADAWLAADAALREEMTTGLQQHASLRDGHLGYVTHVGKALTKKRGAEMLRRAVAVAAMGGGGNDSRDTSLVLRDLVAAAREVRIDAAAEFERVAALAPSTGMWGGSSTSPAAALRGVCATPR